MAKNADYGNGPVPRAMRGWPPDPTMRLLDPIVSSELPLIQRIIEDETWLEGERRHTWVSPDDPVVLEKVCEIILRIGRDLRESVAGRDGTPASRHGEAA
jgi:hypothetical protein